MLGPNFFQPPAGISRGVGAGNDRSQRLIEKPRSRSLENSSDIPEFNQSKQRIELKLSNHKEDNPAHASTVEEEEETESSEQVAAEESRDQFSAAEEKKTPVKRPLRRESSWRQVRLFTTCMLSFTLHCLLL